MSIINIGYYPPTDEVYISKANSKGIGINFTKEFLNVANAYFQENNIRHVISSDGAENLFINIKNDKASIEEVIDKLNKLLETLK